MGHAEAEEDKELMLMRLATLQTMIGKLSKKTKNDITATKDDNKPSQSSSSPCSSSSPGPKTPSRSNIEGLKMSDSPSGATKFLAKNTSLPITPPHGSPSQIRTCTPPPTTLPLLPNGHRCNKISPFSKQKLSTGSSVSPLRVNEQKLSTGSSGSPLRTNEQKLYTGSSGSLLQVNEQTVAPGATSLAQRTATNINSKQQSPLKSQSTNSIPISTAISSTTTSSSSSTFSLTVLPTVPLTLPSAGLSTSSSLTSTVRMSAVQAKPINSSEASHTLSATCLRILKANSLVSSTSGLPQVVQTNAKDNLAPMAIPNVSGLTAVTSSSSNTIITPAIPVSLLSSVKPGKINLVSTNAKSSRDSEILVRKNLTNYSSCAVSAPRVSKSPLPQSVAQATVSVVNNEGRPSSLFLDRSSKISRPVKASSNRLACTAGSVRSDSLRAVTTTKLINKTVTRPPSHTITKPGLSTSPKQPQNEIHKSPPGRKILFQRTTGKVLFDRHAMSASQSKYKLHPPPHNIVPRQNQPPGGSGNFAQEFERLRAKQTNSPAKTFNKKAKYFSADFAPPETSTKARVILSKYKVVRNKDKNVLPSPQKPHIPSALSSTNLLVPGTEPPSTSPGKKVLFQRAKPPSYSKDFTSTYSKKVRRYSVKKINNKPLQNFVSRRMQFIKEADTNPYKLHVKKQEATTPVIPTAANVKSKKEIILSRHGTNYKVSGNLKSLRRLSGEKGRSLKSTPKVVTRPARPIVHQSTHKLLRSSFKQNTRMISAKQYAASQVLKKTMVQQTVRKKVTKEKYCLFYNRFGKCKRGDACKFIHDAEKIAVCTRFLRGACQDENCLFSHKMDPDKMPVCSYFLRGECSRDNCKFRHVKVSQTASVCDDFLKGYCPRGKECTQKHILECEEFIMTGTCTKGPDCHLQHRTGKSRKRTNSGGRPPKGLQAKRRKSDGDDETNQVDGHRRQKQDDKTGQQQPQQQRRSKAKKHKMPKFVSEKIKLIRESTSIKPSSFVGIKKFVEASTTPAPTSEQSITPDAELTPASTNDDIWSNDFIPLSKYSDVESDDDDDEFIQRMFTFK